MRTVHYTTRFKKDIKRLEKQGKTFDTFRRVIKMLADGQPLSEKYRDHQLIGNYVGCRECHIAPNWLLIYEVTDTELILIRSGSHSELFRM